MNTLVTAKNLSNINTSAMTHDELLDELGKRKQFTRDEARRLWEAECNTAEKPGFTSLWTFWQLHQLIVKRTRIGNTSGFYWRKSKQRKRIEQFRKDAANKEARHQFPEARWSGGKATCPLFWMEAK